MGESAKKMVMKKMEKMISLIVKLCKNGEQKKKYLR